MNGDDEEDEDDYDYDDEDDDGDDHRDSEHFHYMKGDIRKDGKWDADFKIYNPKTTEDGGSVACGCANGSSCTGKRVRHVFFKCPYCSAIVSEHRADSLYGSPMSLWCMGCNRHLWIVLKDWDESIYKEGEKKTKKG